jgi:hypothetical protein
MTFFGARGGGGNPLGPGGAPPFGPAVLAPPVAVAPGSQVDALTARIVPLPRTLADLFRFLAQVMHEAVGLNLPPTAGGVDREEYQAELIQSVSARHLQAGLRGLNQRARTCLQEATDVLALVRGLHGLAQLLDEGTVLASAPYYRSSGVYTSLRQAAAALQTAVENHVSGIAPLESTHPAFVSAWRTHATRLDDLLRSPEGLRAFQAFRDDESIPADDRRTVLEFARLVVAVAVNEIAESPHRTQLAEQVERALTTPSQDNLVGFVAQMGAVATGSVGALPGPDAASIVFIKVVGTMRLVDLHADPPALAGLRERLVRWIVRAAAFTPAEEGRFTLQMRAFEIARTGELNDWSQHRERARELLGRKFQTGFRLSAALSVLNVIQLISAISGPAEGRRNPVQASAEITAAGFAAISGTIVTFERAPIPVGRIRTIFHVLNGVVGRAAGFLNATFAITSMIGGGFALAQGMEDHDPWTMAAGGLQIASGIALMIPGGQPIAVVLAIIGTTISARNAILDRLQAGTLRGYRKLLRQLKEGRSSWHAGSTDDATLYIQILGVSAEVEALDRAVGSTSFSNIQTGLSRSMWDSMMNRLRGLGVPEANARLMLDSDLVPAP